MTGPVANPEAVEAAAANLRAAVEALGAGADDREVEDLNALRHLARETEAAASRFVTGADSESFVLGRDAMLSIAWSLRPRPYTWNGLQCGGAYLEGDEYRYLRDVVARHRVRSVVETGAGETTALFARAGLSGLALEAHEGPWVDRARAAGAEAVVVPFDAEARWFDPAAVAVALAGHETADLLFVDSPIGSANRARMVEQLLEAVGARLVLVHDAHRDVRNILDDCTRFGLHLVEYFASQRGFVLLGVGPAEDRLPQRYDPRFPDVVTPVPEPAVELAALDAPARGAAGAAVVTRLRVENRSAGTLTSHGAHPVRVAHHRFVAGACVQPEGPRTALPCSLAPGDVVEFEVPVELPTTAGAHAYQFDLVEEGVTWFAPDVDADRIQWTVEVG